MYSRELEKRRSVNALRSLKTVKDEVDFCSNDYLGFSTHDLLFQYQDNFQDLTSRKSGSTGSRLLSGNSVFAEELEKFIAEFHSSEAGLLFNSGYDANLGVFSSVPARGDTIIYDELVHASIHDGRRLSYADSFKFRHNDTGHLEKRLREAQGTVYVAVESVYSMDGDFAPLQDIAALCRRYDAYLIVDEAHATGIFGEGKGLLEELGLQNEVFARIHTFGKALGCHGAIVTGSALLREFLINFARSFIYTTALPLHSLKLIRSAYEALDKHKDRLETLRGNIDLFRSLLREHGIPAIESYSPIQCVIIQGNTNVKRISSFIQARGFDVRPILSPTVPEGQERLRICLHSFNSDREIKGLVNALNEALVS
jgi:8-amino-7-oxononanoate synthase